MVDVVAESMVGGTTFHREMISMRFLEPWSSTSLARTTVLKHRREKFVLDRAFALIEGAPASGCRLRMRFDFIQQHWDLLDDLDVESFEGGNFSGMIGQQTNPAQVQIRKNLRADADFALGFAFAFG